MSSVTAGSYLGPKAVDPNAELRKIFSEWGNHQDGLGTILSYCQTASGYTVGSWDTNGFIQKLQEFSGVVNPKSFGVASPTDLQGHLVFEGTEQLLELIPDKSKVEKFNMSLKGTSVWTLVQFCIELRGESLQLYIAKVREETTPTSWSKTSCLYGWEVDRQEMIRRADELVAKTSLKDRIDDWTRNITSDGW
ncbi:hypothetical protein BGX29_008179 [Mortierella sp. GBA35]|nr:hypothetical protein BGX29_008179 [Mortierella sp. GBA35]